MKWAVTEKFHDYLYGASFEVITDNNPLTYVLSKAKLDATSHRWVAALANYDFTILYRPGKLNTDADGLSRMYSDSVRAICQAAIASVPLADSVTPDVSLSAGELADVSGRFSAINWAEDQGKDPVIARLRQIYSSDLFPRGEGVRQEQPKVRKYLRERKRIAFDDGVLYRVATVDGYEVKQLLFPEAYRAQALKGVHDDVGHQGKENTLWLARQRFYWPGPEKDVEHMVDHCGRCIRRKTSSRVGTY